MKTLIQNLKCLILVGLITFLTTAQSVGQVVTRVIPPDDQIENYIPWYDPDEIVPIVKIPFVNIEAIQKQDSIEGRHNPRISVKQEVDISGEVGKIIKGSNFSIWNMAIESEGAKSLGV